MPTGPLACIRPVEIPTSAPDKLDFYQFKLIVIYSNEHTKSKPISIREPCGTIMEHTSTINCVQELFGVRICQTNKQTINLYYITITRKFRI